VPGAERGGLGHLEHEVVGRVGRLGDLLGDDAHFLGEIGGRQGRAKHHVGDDFHAQLQAAGQAAHLEAGALVTGGGVHRAAARLDRLDDVAGRALAGALEHHVLEQMRPAGFRLGLRPRAAAGGDRQGQGLVTGRGVGDDADSIAERVDAGHAAAKRRT